jgi:hypothetical protein
MAFARFDVLGGAVLTARRSATCVEPRLAALFTDRCVER